MKDEFIDIILSVVFILLAAGAATWVWNQGAVKLCAMFNKVNYGSMLYFMVFIWCILIVGKIFKANE